MCYSHSVITVLAVPGMVVLCIPSTEQVESLRQCRSSQKNNSIVLVHVDLRSNDGQLPIPGRPSICFDEFRCDHCDWQGFVLRCVVLHYLITPNVDPSIVTFVVLHRNSILLH